MLQGWIKKCYKGGLKMLQAYNKYLSTYKRIKVTQGWKITSPV